MLFNSPEFLLFLPIVFGLYWFVMQRNLRVQNMLLVLASYVFFRAESVGEAVNYIGRMFQFGGSWSWSKSAITVILISVTSELIGFKFSHKTPLWIVWPAYACVIVVLLLESQGAPADFIYFQF